MRSIVKIHREKALYAFCSAMRSAEESLKTGKSKSPNSIEKAYELLDLAELHLCTFDSTKAETEYTEALDIFYQNSDGDNERDHIIYIAYILKALSGIHACLGRKKEAERELKKAMIWVSIILNIKRYI